MKNKITLITLITTIFLFSGCGGGEEYHPPIDSATTLFLVDQDGFSYGGVPYLCDGMINWSQTNTNGEFTFYPGEICTFDFIGLNGNYGNDPLFDDIIQIVDIYGTGKRNIPYNCNSYGPDITGTFGEFFYDLDDICSFEL